MLNARLKLLLTGLAAGDSIGSTSEFVQQSSVPEVFAKYSPRGWPFKQVGGGTFRWQPGEPTDDSEMAMAMVSSYLERGCFDGEDVAKKFVEWMQGGPKDIGGTTSRTLSRIASGTPWYEGALPDFQRNPGNAANGSIMRNGVVPGIAKSLDEAFEITLAHSVMTHYGPLPVLCCAAQTWIIYKLLEGEDMLHDVAWLEWFEDEFCLWLNRSDNHLVRTWRENVAGQSNHVEQAWRRLHDAEFDADRFNPFEYDYSTGQGYVLLTLQIGVWATEWALREAPFDKIPAGFPEAPFKRTGPWTLSWVALVGHDSDTYAATAGPMIAAACGAIPDEFTDRLWVLDEFSNLL